MTSHTGSLKNIRSSASKTLRPLLDFVKSHRNVILLIVSIVLIILAVILVNLLVTQTFKKYFNCNYLIDDTLPGKFSLCEGEDITFGPWTFGPYVIKLFDSDKLMITLGPWPILNNKITILDLPAWNAIDPTLEAARKFVAWNIIIAFVVVSLVLAFIVSKFKEFVGRLLTPEGRKVILTNLSLWLLIFAIFCSLFYFGVVVPSLGK